MWRRPNLWSCWLLHEDPALVHRAILVCHCLEGKELPNLRHTLCWPGLVLFSFFPPRFKSSLKGTHIHSVEYIHQELAEWLRALSQNDFRDCLEAWKAYMEQCVASQIKSFHWWSTFLTHSCYSIAHLIVFARFFICSLLQKCIIFPLYILCNIIPLKFQLHCK
jgi:hypothetical protein